MPVFNVKSWAEGFDKMVPLLVGLLLVIAWSVDKTASVNFEKQACDQKLVSLTEQQAKMFQSLERLCEGDNKQLVIKNVLLKGASWDYEVGCK